MIFRIVLKSQKAPVCLSAHSQQRWLQFDAVTSTTISSFIKTCFCKSWWNPYLVHYETSAAWLLFEKNIDSPDCYYSKHKPILMWQWSCWRRHTSLRVCLRVCLIIYLFICSVVYLFPRLYYTRSAVANFRPCARGLKQEITFIARRRHFHATVVSHFIVRPRKNHYYDEDANIERGIVCKGARLVHWRRCVRARVLHRDSRVSCCVTPHD